MAAGRRLPRRLGDREGWGWHDLRGLEPLPQTTIRDIGQLTKEFATEDVITNDFVAGANDFDHEQVKADAAASS